MRIDNRRAEIVNEIIGYMATSSQMSNIQRVQTEHRMKLAEFWGIHEGQRILEIGCGQGDTTAVLAYLIGDSGFVHGVDIASPDYGAPITVGDAATHLMQSTLGHRILMEYDIDMLSSETKFRDEIYDVVVLSHCSWYLKSHQELRQLLLRARKLGKRLAFAEWDLNPRSPEQLPHFLAALIQGQVESYKDTSRSNIRTLFTRQDLHSIATSVGWDIVRETTVDSPELQDGRWEVEQTLNESAVDLNNVDGLPPKLKALIQSELGLLRAAVEEGAGAITRSLSTFAFVAV